MLQGKHDLSNKKQLGTEKAIILKDQIPEMRQYATKKLVKLELDSHSSIGYGMLSLVCIIVTSGILATHSKQWEQVSMDYGRERTSKRQ